MTEAENIPRWSVQSGVLGIAMELWSQAKMRAWDILVAALPWVLVQVRLHTVQERQSFYAVKFNASGD